MENRAAMLEEVSVSIKETKSPKLLKTLERGKLKWSSWFDVADRGGAMLVVTKPSWVSWVGGAHGLICSKPFIFTFAALLLILTSSAQQQQQCSNCGNTLVPYPLSTAPTCGDQAYKICCDVGRLLFDTVNNTYPITSVNPTNQRLVIKSVTLLSNNMCVTSDIVHEGIQLNSSLPFNITNMRGVDEFNKVRIFMDAGLCCTFRTGGSSTEHRIRIREAGCSAYTSFVNLDPNLPVDRWPEPGLEIQRAFSG
ncbi:hypothetical protein CMV_026223 [Castanea mollissima]|uniref:Wall-associated receptor kinase galacturonan-binding domain-containing protein n=1 Tax=Castanea mollissima TaxID=60419 RepID=A0A8J4QDE7_9ROSI|nr:hypothetical protein CMV_026223 [Castanea mollissima]